MRKFNILVVFCFKISFWNLFIAYFLKKKKDIYHFYFFLFFISFLLAGCNFERMMTRSIIEND